jgi:hypothetical protein
MSKLSVDQKNIFDLLKDKKADFLIPDYQRPYAWQEKECQKLWDDIFEFAIPENDATKFDTNDEYFLGPIVTFTNKNKKLEVIDGQQRLTTILLLLRAFYAKYGSMQDEQSRSTRENIEKCIWKTDEFGKPNLDELKIDSEVAMDKYKDEFLNILKTGIVEKDQKSKYAENYRFFQEKINNFLDTYPGYFSYLPIRILNNCILLPIEAESQETALRIFSTLNDRGLPLSDADIFKAQFYKYYSEKDSFVKKWKELEELCESIFHPSQGTPMDELFTRYMYFVRAKMGIKSSTTEALRSFYEKDSYKLLKNDYIFDDLINLADFWKDVLNQNVDRFSDRILKRLFVLNYAPNGMWTYFTSVYYLQNRDKDNMLDDQKFYEFLNKIIAFIWTYAVYMPGVNALRTPVYAEMINIVNNKQVEFNEFKFEEQVIKQSFENYEFYNRRPITKAMLTWYAFQNESQELQSLDVNFDIEHILAKGRQEIDSTLKNRKNLECLGNKELLERKINIPASEYRFKDKKKFYYGFTTDKGAKKVGTNIKDLIELADTHENFEEVDIIERNNKILNEFYKFLKRNNLFKE